MVQDEPLMVQGEPSKGDMVQDEPSKGDRKGRPIRTNLRRDDKSRLDLT